MGMIHRADGDVRTLTVEPGVWGLILAPENYYKKHSSSFAECNSLLTSFEAKHSCKGGFRDFRIFGRRSDYLNCSQLVLSDSIIPDMIRGLTFAPEHRFCCLAHS